MRKNLHTLVTMLVEKKHKELHDELVAYLPPHMVPEWIVCDEPGAVDADGEPAADMRIINMMGLHWMFFRRPAGHKQAGVIIGSDIDNIYV